MRRHARRLFSRRGRSYPLEDVAALAHRLAVLLGAGVAPASAWRHLAASGLVESGSPVVGGAPGSGRARRPQAEEEGLRAILDQVATAAERGLPLEDALHEAASTCAGSVRAAWNALAASWSVAADAGAPLAHNLIDLAETLRSLAQIERDLDVALAGPVATARIVLVLPGVGLLFGVGLGFDTLRTLFLTPVGLACLAVGALLLVAATRWNAALIAAAAPRDVTPGLALDLLAIAMSGGASANRARHSVELSMTRFGVDAEPEQRVIDAVLDLSVGSGVPAASLLRAEAEQCRRRARSDARRAAETAAAALMVPLGVCVLPAFIAVGVAPLLLSVISSTVTRL